MLIANGERTSGEYLLLKINLREDKTESRTCDATQSSQSWKLAASLSQIHSFFKPWKTIHLPQRRRKNVKRSRNSSTRRDVIPYRFKSFKLTEWSRNTWLSKMVWAAWTCWCKSTEISVTAASASLFMCLNLITLFQRRVSDCSRRLQDFFEALRDPETLWGANVLGASAALNWMGDFDTGSLLSEGKSALRLDRPI